LWKACDWEVAPRRVARVCRLHTRAVAHHGCRRLSRAAVLCRRAFRLLEQACGPAHPNVANVLNSLGRIPLDQDRLGEAEAFSLCPGDHEAVLLLIVPSARPSDLLCNRGTALQSRPQLADGSGEPSHEQEATCWGTST